MLGFRGSTMKSFWHQIILAKALVMLIFCGHLSIFFLRIVFVSVVLFLWHLLQKGSLHLFLFLAARAVRNIRPVKSKQGDTVTCPPKKQSCNRNLGLLCSIHFVLLIIFVVFLILVLVFVLIIIFLSWQLAICKTKQEWKNPSHEKISPVKSQSPGYSEQNRPKKNSFNISISFFVNDM